MPDPADTPPDSPLSPLDDALDRMRVYFAHLMRDDDERMRAFDAIPGFREAVAEAEARARSRGGGGQAVHLPTDPHFAAAYEVVVEAFRPRDEARQAERDAVVVVFGVFDESDIRRLLDLPLSEPGLNFAQISGVLSTACNPNVLAPLVDRLQNEVVYEVPRFPSESRFTRFVANRILYDRALRRDTQETHRVLDRTLTIRILGRLGDRRAEPAIRPFLDDKDERVRDAARKALELWAVEAKEEDTDV